MSLLKKFKTPAQGGAITQSEHRFTPTSGSLRSKSASFIPSSHFVFINIVYNIRKDLSSDFMFF